ncbi:unnamed protein product, partial [marine sediment metagenome]
GLETAEAKPVKDLDGDGILNLGSPGREIVFVLSESPKPVGGTVELVAGDSNSPSEATGSSRDYTAPLAAAAVGIATILAIAASGWYVRRRWLR